MIEANAEKFQSLIPLQVGRKMGFKSAGAGTFPAFVILYDEQSPQSTHGQWQYRYWYSPDIGHTVKFEFLTLRGNPPPKYPKNWELTAYKPVASTQ